jgi:hypothetical protein
MGASVITANHAVTPAILATHIQASVFSHLIIHYSLLIIYSRGHCAAASGIMRSSQKQAKGQP